MKRSLCIKHKALEAPSRIRKFFRVFSVILITLYQKPERLPLVLELNRKNKPEVFRSSPDTLETNEQEIITFSYKLACVHLGGQVT